ncbi:MAG: YceI family protein [Phycisphaerae bacterium]|nr:YceI family protein [Phycisphaerae bacterium]MDW8262315.1 YceI family protein [Phycisphaerales bacterium]
MRRVTYFAAAFAAMYLVSLAGAAEQFKLDPVHSSLLFRVKHLGVSYTWGSINQPEGTIVWDSADPTRSSFHVTANAANIDTANAKRDQHLKSPDFFDAKQFPTLSFKSTSVKALEGNKYEVSGELTIRGQTRPVSVVLEHVGTVTNERGTKTGFDGSFTINRHDFGVSYGAGSIGDEVTIIVAIEADKV